jgi:hyaluronan synthase
MEITEYPQSNSRRFLIFSSGIFFAGLPLYFLSIVIINWENSLGWINYFNRTLNEYIFYLPIGIIGLWRWLVWLIKKIYSLSYCEIKPNIISPYSNTITIITAVYRENPKIFEDALRSWDKNHPDEIIAVIDYSDQDCINVFKTFSEEKTYTKLIVTTKQSKRDALAEGIPIASGEILALVDSDTIWSDNLKQNALAPFQFKEIGGVTVRCHPLDRKSIWAKMTDFFWDLRNYYDLPSQTAMGRSLTCLTGRTSFYRKNLILPKLHEFTNEIIFGVKKESGEDKCLTRMLQNEGWKTYYQKNAIVFSSAAEDFKTFIKQRIRWSRNSHNSDIVSITQNNAWEKNPSLTFFMTDRLISIFTLLLGPIFLGIAVYQNHWLIAYSILILWFVGRSIRILPHLRRKPKDIFLMPVFIFVQFLSGFAKLYSLVSIREQKRIRDSSNIKSRIKVEPRVVRDVVITSEIFIGMIFVVYIGLK